MSNTNICKLQWTIGHTCSIGDVIMKSAIANHTFTDLQPAIGIDPGRQFGIGMVLPYPNNIIGGYFLSTYWGKLPKQDKHQEYFEIVRRFVNLWMPPKCPAKIVIVEGPSYFDKYGQVQLEDIRLAFYQTFKDMGYEAEYCPPTSARKKVLGNGRLKASSLWLNLNPNAADAGVLALYGGGFEHCI